MDRFVLRMTLAVALLPGWLWLSGCAGETEGEQTLERADRMQDAGELIRRGELNVADGKALVAHGEQLKRQAADVEGDRLIAEGRSRQKLGEEQIEQGRSLRAKAR
jgi:hypothetical protein